MENNWCVEVTSGNREELQKFIGLSGYCWSNGAYYGVRDGDFYGHQKSFAPILTIEEFRRKILKQNYEPEYEIY